MKTVLDILQKAGGWHHGLHLHIENPPYMALVIEATDESGPCGLPAFSVCHYGEQNGDAMRDPEMCFELGFAGGAHLNPFYWRNDYAGIEQWSRFIRDAHYCYHTQLHAQHERFAKLWDKNLRQQGFAEAFERQRRQRLTQVSPPTKRRQGSVSASPPQPPTTFQRSYAMQDSSAFQYLAIDTIHESTTNPRQTFEQSKLEELAESIRQHGLIQPITVRPNANGFEIVAGARRFRASQLAELFSLPARIVELTDAAAMEWQLVENSQRVDVHPYEEAQGFQRLLDLPGYDVAALVAKSGKSAAHIYARLSLLQLIPDVGQAFIEERITASHANLLARLPQEHQATAYENCWRKDWQDKEPHLLPAKHLSSWIQANLYLNLAEAPFDREDTTLNPSVGACVTCPRRSGYNTSLFADVQGDQCLDAPCFQLKVTAHIDREIAARPELVQLETAWRNPKEQQPGALQKYQYRELDIADNPDAEPPCVSTKSAIIVFGKHAGHTLTVCTEPKCPVHNPQVAAQRAADPPPTIAPAPEQETEEEAAQREAAHEQRMAEYQAQQERKEEERKAEIERQRQEYEVEQARKTELRNARLATFERILGNAPVAFTAPQLRLFLSALVNLDPYDFAEDVAEFYVGRDENNQQTPEDVLSSIVAGLPDEKLTGFALRLVLTGHTDIPRENDFDFLAQAEAAFAPPQPEKAAKKAKATREKGAKAKPEVVKSPPKKSAADKKAA